MLRGLILGLFAAWVLSLFGINTVILEAIQLFCTSVILTDNRYYILFGMIGMVGGLFNRE